MFLKTLNMLGFYSAAYLYPDFMPLLKSPVWKSSSCLSSPVIQKVVWPKLSHSAPQTTRSPSSSGPPALPTALELWGQKTPEFINTESLHRDVLQRWYPAKEDVMYSLSWWTAQKISWNTHLYKKNPICFGHIFISSALIFLRWSNRLITCLEHACKEKTVSKC